MNGPAQEPEGGCLTRPEALRLARQLSAELPGWVCEVMQDPCTEEWLVCIFHSERWEQFIRYDTEPCWMTNTGKHVALQ